MTFLFTKCYISWLKGGICFEKCKKYPQSSRNDRKSFNLAKNAQKIPSDFSYSKKNSCNLTPNAKVCLTT